MRKLFSQSQVQAIADALGHTTEGLTGSEIEFLLATSRINDRSPDLTKRHRLYNAFASAQNAKQDRIPILAFIRFAMKPASFIRQPERYGPMRRNLNIALSFAGLAVDAAGIIIPVNPSSTLSDARRRANDLRADLELRNIHKD